MSNFCGSEVGGPVGGIPFKITVGYKRYDSGGDDAYLELRLVVRQVKAHLDLLRIMVVHVDEIKRPEVFRSEVRRLLSFRVVLTSLCNKFLLVLEFVILHTR